MVFESLTGVLDARRADPALAQLCGKKAVYEPRTKRVVVQYETSEHILPADFLPLCKRLGDCGKDGIELRASQTRHADLLLSNPELLVRCVKDFCVVSRPPCLTFMGPATIQYRPPVLEVGVPNEQGLSAFTALHLDKLICTYFANTYAFEISVRVRVDEGAQEEYEAPGDMISRLEQEREEAVQSQMELARKMAQNTTAAERAASPPRKQPAPAPAPAEPSLDVIRIRDLTKDASGVIDAKVISADVRTARNGMRILSFCVTDYTGSATCVFFERSHAIAAPSVGAWTQFEGRYEEDRYSQKLQFVIKAVRKSAHVDRQDLCEEKRVELHAHTKMSAMDAVTDIDGLVRRAASFGHDAIAITDHGVTQAFPAAASAAKKSGIKLIYGTEAYMFDDETPVWQGPQDATFDDEIVVFDFETTGLSPLCHEITEIGAVRVKDRQVGEVFKTYVHATRPISRTVTELTGISAETLRDAPEIGEALAAFKEFCGDAVLAAHNASFDRGFLAVYAQECGIRFNNASLDTLLLARMAFPALSSHKLENIASHLGITYDAHRAYNDAHCTARVMLECFRALEERGADTPQAMNGLMKPEALYKSARSYQHIILLCKNKDGMTDLNRLVSESHIKYLKRKKPRMPKSLISSHRENLIVGSACESGELFRAIVGGAPQERLEQIASYYDYLEIQPIGNNRFLTRNGTLRDDEDLRECNRRIVALGDKIGKPVAATCDVHFLDPEDEGIRRIMQDRMNFSETEQPPLFFRTTQEMLDEFEYLGAAKAHEVVVDVPQAIAGQIGTFELLPNETIMPVIEGASEEIERMAYENARAMYGDPLPDIVRKRLERELGSIIGHGFSVLYYSAHLLVQKSNEDGYLVGSRGSVGSSLAATMTGITEVNPLPPHYVCPMCRHSDFDVDTGKYDVGADMPDRNCPVCGTAYKKQGFNIPFEVFLGIDADKVPDIDLNFSSEYQSTAHKYTEELFGKGHVFRAGTISSLKDRNAYAFAKSYGDDHGIEMNDAEIVRIQKGLEGVKKTTGQHPGGMVIVPKDRDVYEFTAVQWPANEEGADFVTTHFDFRSMHDVLVKLDILGHDAPTIMRLMQDLTGMDPLEIPIADPDAIRLFSSIEPLGIRSEDLFGITKGTLGVPEFGTSFVRQMLEDTKPTTVAEIIRISGLSHGTDVWLGNAQDLIRNGTCTLSQAICARDDIMNYLVARGVDKREAFFIMEDTRKGKVARNGFSERAEKALSEADIPSWFLDSCRKIKYMFPKGHAVAYCLMALRIAYCKIHHVPEFYATYFDVNVDKFDATWVQGGLDGIRERYMALSTGNGKDTDKTTATLLELAAEMYLRGLKFLNVDVMRSDPIRFLIEEEGIRMPLVAIPKLGYKVACTIREEREKESFLSIEDLKKRTKVSSSVADAMKEAGALEGLTQTDQISLFDF